MYYNEVHVPTFLEMYRGGGKLRRGFSLRGVESKKCQTVSLHENECGEDAELICSLPSHVIYSRQQVKNLLSDHDKLEMFQEGEDHTPDEISEEEKWKKEVAILDRVTPLLGERGKIMRKNIEEFQANTTPEAKLANQIDKMNAIPQALEYERQGYKRMEEFYPWTLERLTDPLLIKICRILIKNEFKEWNIPYRVKYHTLIMLNGDESLYQEGMERFEKNGKYKGTSFF